MKDYHGCKKPKKLLLHKRVECCPTCHNLEVLFDDLPGKSFDGYSFTLPDGEEVGVCCKVGDELVNKHLDRFYASA